MDQSLGDCVRMPPWRDGRGFGRRRMRQPALAPVLEAQKITPSGPCGKSDGEEVLGKILRIGNAVNTRNKCVLGTNEVAALVQPTAGV